MTKEEINRYIHEQILGKCWHTPMIAGQGNSGRNWQCAKGDCNADLGYQWDEPKPIDYCSDTSPRSLLDEVVAKLVTDEKSGPFFADDPAYRLGEMFCDLNGLENLHDNPNMRYSDVIPFLSATAEQIARACVEAHKSEGDSNER